MGFAGVGVPWLPLCEPVFPTHLAEWYRFADRYLRGSSHRPSVVGCAIVCALKSGLGRSISEPRSWPPDSFVDDSSSPHPIKNALAIAATIIQPEVSVLPVIFHASNVRARVSELIPVEERVLSTFG